ncbi:cellulase family glycosylhydrolase [Opitutus sp. GAS368]|uniref:cellulase family glycosylhydrolase n=1 Tax=Opitutus sp. GAS368 TaxID=1882749 RepID=UPI00087A4977|nr:cellulase family glycosylhydrolase [Opitutus sp. GAS368]SDS04671.1 Aryl-phospho-beta-D-glucosidase BglC, GH1 family [Opitutus sp. GAS368]
MSTLICFKSGVLVAAGLILAVQPISAAELTAADFLKVDGTVLKREKGKGAVVTLRGTNLGGWFVQEGWMSPNGRGTLRGEGWRTAGSRGTHATTLDAKGRTGWGPGALAAAEEFTLDIGQLRAFDQMVIDFGPGSPPRGLSLRVSRDGATWSDMRLQSDQNPAGGQIITLGGSCTARYLHLRATGDTGAPWSIAAINLRQGDDYTVRMTLLDRFGEKEADRLIGVFQETWIRQADIDNIRTMGMNVVRIPLNWLDFMREDGSWKPDPWMRLDRVVELCRQRGIYVILDLHAVPGGASPWASSGREGDDGTGQNCNGFWSGPEDQGRLIRLWEKIAAHYRSSPAIAGYDLINEPLVHFDETPRPGQKYSDAALQKAGLFDRVYRAVRAADPDHVILIAAYTVAPPDNTAYIGTPSGFTGITPPSFHGWTNVVYETHHYDMSNARSHEAQHNLVVNALKDIAHFQKEWNVPIYAGEYSLYGFYDVWAEWMTGLNALDVSWTNWAYKVRGGADEPGGGNWGFYNNNQNAVPDINQDSADTIAAKWSRFTTTEFTRNSPLIEVVSRYTPGLPPAADAPRSVTLAPGLPAAGNELMVETVARRPAMGHLLSTAADSPLPTASR